MERLMFVTIAVLLSISNAYAEPDPCNDEAWEVNYDDLTVEQIGEHIKKYNEECSAEKKRARKYREWLNDPIAQKTEAYFVPKNTIIGKSREQYIKVYNYTLAQGGIFNIQKVRSKGRFNGVIVTQGWTIARIIERVPGSNVVKIEYQRPFLDVVIDGWVLDGALPLWEEYRQSGAR